MHDAPAFQQGIQEDRPKKNAARSGGERFAELLYTSFAESLCHIEPCLGSSHRARFRVGWTAPFGALWMPY